MMHSVAFTDSHQVECQDEFILVQPPEYTSFDLMEQDEDDDSYDYCEDFYSVVSAEEQSLSGCSEMVVEYDHNHNDSKHDDVIFTVPSVLLKDLDDAHAAAKLAQIPDSEQRSDASTFSGARSSIHDLSGMDVDARDETMGEARDSQNGADQPNHQDHDVYNLKLTTKLSRCSNKKRRKKLKLMKKAVAASTAALALSDRGASRPVAKSSPSPPTPPKIKSAKPTTARSTKRVANIAVACATETLSSYREELAKANKRYVA
jgi:hypothetical protein